MKQRTIIKLTSIKDSPILIGIASIISIEATRIQGSDSSTYLECTKIQSVEKTSWVKEPVEEIWQTINQ